MAKHKQPKPQGPRASTPKARATVAAPAAWQEPTVLLRLAAWLLTLAVIPLVALTFSFHNTYITEFKQLIWFTLTPLALTLALVAHALAPWPGWRLPPLVWPAVALLVVVYGLSTLMNLDYLNLTYKHAATTACGLVTLLLFALMGRQAGFCKQAAACITLTLGVVALYGVAQGLGFDEALNRELQRHGRAWGWGTDFDWGMPLRRVFSTFGNPTMLAGYLVLLLPVSLCLAASLRRPRWKRIVLLTWLVGVLALVMTYSRGGALGFVVSVLTLLLLLGRPLAPNGPGVGALWRIWPRLWQVAGVMVVVAGIALGALYGGLFMGVVGRLWDASALGRYNIYQGTLEMVAQRPLLGYGPGAFPIHFPDHWPPELSESEPRSTHKVNHAHSEFLQLLAEQGILGLAALLFLLGVVVVPALRAHRRELVGPRWWLRLALLAGLAGCLADSLFSVGMRYVGTLAMFWMVLGLLIAGVPLPPRAPSRAWSRRTAAVAAALICLLLGVYGVRWYIADGHLRLMIAYAQRNAQGDLAVAGQLAQRALGWDSTLTQARLMLADIDYESGDFEACIARCEEILARERYFANVAMRMGTAYLRIHDGTRALELFEETVRAEPGYVDGHHGLGSAYLLLTDAHAGDRDQQRAHLRRGLEALTLAHRLAGDAAKRATLERQINHAGRVLQVLEGKEVQE